jgi:hypothetical protein
MKILEIIERSKATTRPLPLTWVFIYKFDKQGFLRKFKARICVRGDLQPLSEKETYAATLAGRSFRMLMTLAARWDLEICQLDTVNASPNSELDEEVYMSFQTGLRLQAKYAVCCELSMACGDHFCWGRSFSQEPCKS